MPRDLEEFQRPEFLNASLDRLGAHPHFFRDCRLTDPGMPIPSVAKQRQPHQCGRRIQALLGLVDEAIKRFDLLEKPPFLRGCEVTRAALAIVLCLPALDHARGVSGGRDTLWCGGLRSGMRIYIHVATVVRGQFRRAIRGRHRLRLSVSGCCLPPAVRCRLGTGARLLGACAGPVGQAHARRVFQRCRSPRAAT